MIVHIGNTWQQTPDIILEGRNSKVLIMDDIQGKFGIKFKTVDSDWQSFEKYLWDWEDTLA